MAKYETVVLISYEVEAENANESAAIAEQLFNGDTHPEIMGIDVNPIDDEEPDYCDDDCGFDPYMGCYTDDC